MKNELKNNLLEYLGELMCESDSTHDWIEKDKLTVKINAVNTILGFPSEGKTWFQKVAAEIHNLHVNEK